MTIQAAARLSKQIIVVVDDDHAVRDSLRNLMEVEGFAVRDFSSGQDLLDETSLPVIACLVVDYEMPAMNGLELVRALRGRGVSPPAILFTANSGQHVRDRAAAISAVVVQKPGLELLDRVREAVAKHADGA
jgi:FixJ family two-component response regulator